MCEGLKWWRHRWEGIAMVGVWGLTVEVRGTRRVLSSAEREHERWNKPVAPRNDTAEHRCSTRYETIKCCAVHNPRCML